MSTSQKAQELSEHVIELLYQELEAEQGDVLVCQAALSCVENEELRDTWERHLQETERHVVLLTGLLEELGLDPDQETPGRRRVRAISFALIRSILLGLGGDRAVVLASKPVDEFEVRLN